MALTKGRIHRTGTIVFHDASLSIWEEGLSGSRAAGGFAGEDCWKRDFKRDVFLRVAQMLRRLGWSCSMPPIDAGTAKRYGGNVARWWAENHRECSKGTLSGELDINGCCVEFKMWQDTQNISNSNGGKYDFDKEDRMTYLQRLEMERTRRRIRDYLCNIFTGYVFEERRTPKIGLMGVTAEEYAASQRRSSGHYRPELDRASISMESNAIARDGGVIEHGARVWALDHQGRFVTGTAYYLLNNNWHVVTGRYGLTHAHTGEIFTRQPENLRTKRNNRERRKRLERELQIAIHDMNFQRAQILKDLLFPGNPALFNVWHKGHKAFHCADFCGYTTDQTKAGKFTSEEVRGWDCEPNQIISCNADVAKAA
ncbi:hypothetical protein [Burkholderia gladioli]|uniref:hypothetical protein n=1 Tax=Burkholderia gladioli TaxID=28095 RepID=UPI001C2218B4|nr:hypothetical protein [Burkholderia gladioli]MBU9174018.1 hypothetical protein [Burkholderia gladioli]